MNRDTNTALSRQGSSSGTFTEDDLLPHELEAYRKWQAEEQAKQEARAAHATNGHTTADCVGSEFFTDGERLEDAHNDNIEGASPSTNTASAPRRFDSGLEGADCDQQGSFVLVRRSTTGLDDELYHPGVYKEIVEDKKAKKGKEGPSDEEEEPIVRWSWICSPIEVVAKARDGDKGNWSRLLIVVDDDGEQHEWVMPRELLARGTDVVAELYRRGARVGTEQGPRQLLQAYLQAWNPADRMWCVDRTGWHELAERQVFVLPDQAFNGPPCERIVLQAKTQQHLAAGTFAEWQERVATPALGNSRVVFAISCAFAGPLLEPTGSESGGFHLTGSSSIGKTVALRCAASVWGLQPASWRATDNGLEAVARGANDLLLCLDEMGQVKASVAGAVAYMLANGVGKARMSRSGEEREPARWRVLFLSTGEHGLAEKMNEAGEQAQAGQQVRVIEVPADAGKGYGIFANLHGAATSAAFALAMDSAATKVAGHAGPLFVRRLALRRKYEVERIKAGIEAWTTKRVPAGADGQVYRAAGRFALVAVAGELAIEWGVLPWPKGTASAAAAECFDVWLASRGGAAAAETIDGLAQVRAFLEQHGSSRFETPWDDTHDYRSDMQKQAAEIRGDKAAIREQERREQESADLLRNASHEVHQAHLRTVNRAGYRRQVRDGDGLAWEYYVTPEMWKAEVCRGRNAAAIARDMATRGWLERGDDRNLTRKIRVPGVGLSRYYHVTSQFMQAP